MKDKWTFWIDCGGTFTDIIAVNSSGEHKVHKLLSKSPHYKSVVAQGIEDILGHKNFKENIKELRLGTTIATNAFLEKNGIDCALVTTLGHRDLLEIKQQNRDDLFAIDIKKQKPLYKEVTHVQERIDANGEVLTELDLEIARFELQRILDKDIKSLAISLMHSTLNPKHEIALKKLALEMGFNYVSASHEISPIAKYISRTQTALIDSYLTPFLQQYTSELSKLLEIDNIYYMQSDGSLCTGENLKGYSALLSGPAGGLIGAIKAAKDKGIDNIITFDMGGTSTDVALYHGDLKINPEPNFYGHKLLTPMVDIHTVAAGGGSVLSYDNGRFIVGPESAGAYPGPACYRNGGPLTVTDANLFLKRINPEKFPKVFGKNRDQALDSDIVEEKFMALSKETGMKPEEIANGFLDVAVETMSRAIRKVSIESGFDPKDFCLVSFGGAGGQLALKVAESLNIQNVFTHPFSAVLSAYGIGVADHAMVFSDKLRVGHKTLQKRAQEAFPFSDFSFENTFMIKAIGSDHELPIKAKNLEDAKELFKKEYKRTFELNAPNEIECDTISVKILKSHSEPLKLSKIKEAQIDGFEILNENNTSIIIEDDWLARNFDDGSWKITKNNSTNKVIKRDKAVELEIFYQRFQFIAEQMGYSLQKLARSVNIKERNDFSCALFTADGELVANAPHIPVHLGSMGDAVKSLIKDFSFKNGDSFITNSPHYGGTHLPDITIITPIFDKNELIMWVASRGHHADIGGVTPGSMPGDSKKLYEEGVVIPPTTIASFGELDKKNLKEILTKTEHPVRNYEVNEHDIAAKIAANLKGTKEIQALAKKYGSKYLDTMSKEILSYSFKKIQVALKGIKAKKITKHITDKRQITLELKKDKNKFIFDFNGTSPIQDNNFNAPIPVVKATLLFCLRCLINENIPLNNGIMQGVELLIPKESLLSPSLDSAVVAGNVETSQALCDVIFEALDIKAHSQGTMNNLSFGNNEYQYYETIAGGSGASKFAHGASAVQVNMTNSRLTDPEILEMRYPIRLELMSIRHGSGGIGQFNGGDGIYRRIKFLEPMQVSMLTQAREIPPQGINKGRSAQRGLNQVEDAGKLIELAESFQKEFSANDTIFISTPGGGGYGKSKVNLKNLIFGFGSNMDLAQIKSRCPSSELICRAKVLNKEIRYTRYSETRKGGVADMYDADGHQVYGLVISIDDKDLAHLDKIECDDNGYKRVEIDAYDDNNQKFHCYAYDVIDKKPDIAPTKVYEWLVYSGAYYLNAPEAYLEKIRSYRKA